jgi:RimJ/RimL family protein N-acetyltransferase
MTRKNAYREKIILRPIRTEDREFTVRWRNDLFIKSSTMSHPFPVTEEMEKEWYEETAQARTTVISRLRCHKRLRKVIGFFSLNNINWISRIDLSAA